MKRFISALSVLALSATLSLPAQAAPQAIQVYLDGSKVTFPTGAPYSSQNTTLVPFRTIFEKLGLQVTWNAKTQTVTGKKEGLTIQLTIGSNRASINGVVKKLTALPTTIKGTTYVPLRFIGEASDAEVEWDEESNSITIQTAKSKALEEEKIRTLLEQAIGFLDKGDYNGLHPLLSEDSPYQNSGKEFKEWAESNQQQTKVVEYEFVTLDQRYGDAFVETVEDTHRTGGVYSPDMLNQVMYTLVKENGIWKLDDLEVKDTQYKLPDDALTKAVNVPGAEDSKIKDTINLFTKYTTDKNMDGIIPLADPSILAEDFKEGIQSYFEYIEELGMSPKFSDPKIIYYSDKEAAVYFEEIYTNPDTKAELITGNVFVLNKSSEGKWLIIAGYDVSRTYKEGEN